MKLIFLGTRSEKAFPRRGQHTEQDREARRMKDRYYHYLQSSLLIEWDRHRVMIDYGNELVGLLDKHMPEALLLTHSHPDHAWGLREFARHELSIPVYSAPATLTDIKQRFKLKGNFNKLPAIIGNMLFEPIKVAHSTLSPAIAIKFNNIVYAPDYLRFLEPDKLRGVKLLIVDGSSTKRDIKRSHNVGHASILNSIITAEKFSIPSVIVTHIGHIGLAYHDLNDLVDEMGRQHGVKVKIARDGMAIDIPWRVQDTKENAMTQHDICMFKLEGYRPEKVNDRQLLDDQRLIAAKYATMRRGGKTEFKNIDELIAFGTTVIAEIFRRGKARFHWDKLKPSTKELLLRIMPRLTKRALYFPEPHGRMLINGSATAMIRPQHPDIVNEPLGIVSGQRLLGYIRFAQPKMIGLNEFKALREYHRITDNERKSRWPKQRIFFFFPVKDRFPLSQPKRVRIKAGSQTFIQLMKANDPIDPLNIDPRILAAMSDLRLIALHGRIHDIFGKRGSRINDELVINAHALVLKELRRRKLEHRFIDELDRLTYTHKILLEDIAELFNDFALKKPFLSLIGSTAVSGQGNDIDIWVNWSKRAAEYFLDTIAFRIQSMLPDDLKHKLHLVPTPEQGPFTNYIELADLEVRFRPAGEWRVIRMAMDDDIAENNEFISLQELTDCILQGES